MISHVRARCSANELYIQLAEGRDFVPVNQTPYVLISVYPSFNWNPTMKQITTTLHAVIDDSRFRDLPRHDLFRCRVCKALLLSPDGSCMACGGAQFDSCRLFEVLG